MAKKRLQSLERIKSIFQVALFALLGLFLISLAALSWIITANMVKEGKYIGWEVKANKTIKASGRGVVYAKADVAVVDFSVKQEAKKASQAMQKGSRKMNAIISALKGMGILAKDLKTTGFSLRPRYEYRRSESGQFIPYPGKRVLVGYEAEQTLQVKIRDLDKVGKIIQTATSLGANQAGSLRFVIDNPESLKDKARAEAIAKAKERAQSIARQLGVKLVRVVSFNEAGQRPVYPLYKEMEAEGGNQEAAPPQVEPGTNKIEVSVTITYEIK